MLPDRQEFSARHAEQKSESKTDAIRRLQQFRRASVEASLLTGDPNWDAFLTYIQAAIEESDKSAQATMAALANPRLVDDNETRALRTTLLLQNERSSAWRSVIALPKDLIAEGDKAKSLMDRMEAA